MTDIVPARDGHGSCPSPYYPQQQSTKQEVAAIISQLIMCDEHKETRRSDNPLPLPAHLRTYTEAL
uniref:Uncharacterized protein n=1 Tax=Wuchereria bancrofti TaxID=6293 RepID=A0A1I8EHL1_WUCBA